MCHQPARARPIGLLHVRREIADLLPRPDLAEKLRRVVADGRIKLEPVAHLWPRCRRLHGKNRSVVLVCPPAIAKWIALRTKNKTIELVGPRACSSDRDREALQLVQVRLSLDD